MAYYCVFGGAGFFTAPTLGNLITASKVRVTAKKMAMPSAGGFLFSQSGAGSSREFGILINSGELRYVYGSSTERVIFTSGEMVSTFGTAPYKCDLLDIIFDTADNTVKVFVNGSASPAKTVALVKGTSRIDGMLFRVGARCDSDSATSVGGGFITPNLTWVGDLKIYIDDALVRDYVIPSTGTTIPDLVGGSTLTQRGTWPSDNSEWVFYSTGESLAFSGTLPKLTAAISATATNSIDASFSGTLPKLTAAISADVTYGIGASFAGTLPKLTASINATVSTGTDSLSFGGTLPKLTASISANVSAAPNSLSFSGTLPKLRVSISATVSLPPPLVAFSGTLPRLRMQAAMTIQVPEPAGDPLALKQALVNARRAEENRNNEYVPPVVIVPEWYIIQQRALGLKQGEVNRARDEE